MILAIGPIWNLFTSTAFEIRILHKLLSIGKIAIAFVFNLFVSTYFKLRNVSIYFVISFVNRVHHKIPTLIIQHYIIKFNWRPLRITLLILTIFLIRRLLLLFFTILNFVCVSLAYVVGSDVVVGFVS